MSYLEKLLNLWSEIAEDETIPVSDKREIEALSDELMRKIWPYSY